MPQLLGQDYWGGVCGFVSVIHGILLYKGGDALDGLTTAELEYNIGTSLLAFLKHVKSKPEIADQIVKFTQAFGGVHAKKNLDQLIMECELAVKELAKPGATGKQTGEDGWGVAMTKDALIEYMKWLGVGCRERTGITMWSQSVLKTCKHCVVGVGKQADSKNGFGGLRHWVYVNEDGVMYNWGKETVLRDIQDRPYEGYEDRHNVIVHVLELTR